MSPLCDMKAHVDEPIWKALADPSRRRILDALADGAMSTGEVVALFDDLCRTAVMKHLDVLVAANLVIVRREGRFRWNSINPVPIERVCARWVNRHVRRKASALNRLKDVVESAPVTMKKKQPCRTPK